MCKEFVVYHWTEIDWEGSTHIWTIYWVTQCETVVFSPIGGKEQSWSDNFQLRSAHCCLMDHPWAQICTHIWLYRTWVYHVENYMIHHHVVLHGGSRSKNADLKFHSFFFKEADEVQYKRKTPARRVVRVGRSRAGIRRRNDASKWPPYSHHPTRGVFL